MSLMFVKWGTEYPASVGSSKRDRIIRRGLKSII